MNDPIDDTDLSASFTLTWLPARVMPVTSEESRSSCFPVSSSKTPSISVLADFFDDVNFW